MVSIELSTWEVERWGELSKCGQQVGGACEGLDCYVVGPDVEVFTKLGGDGLR